MAIRRASHYISELKQVPWKGLRNCQVAWVLWLLLKQSTRKLMKSSGSHLRTTQQVSNVRRQLKIKQEGDCQLAKAMKLCKTGLSGSGEDFVRSVRAASKHMCILATDRQLDEMLRSCTDLTAFVPMGVDLTLKLGKFF